MEGWTTKVLKSTSLIVDAIERVVVEHDARAAHRDGLVGASAAQPCAGLALGR